MVPDEDAARRKLEQLFDTYADRVFSFASHRLGPHAAADVVSETFLAAWRRLDSLREPALPWLLGTARKIIANELRRQSRHSALVERLSAVPAVPEDAADAAIKVGEVWAALAQLSELDQEVLMVSAWYDLTAVQASRVLGCSPATYAVRLHRARRRLRQQLDNAEGRCPTYQQEWEVPQ